MTATVLLILPSFNGTASPGNKDATWLKDARVLIHRIVDGAKAAGEKEHPTLRGPTAIRRNIYRFWILTGYCEPFLRHASDEVWHPDVAATVAASFEEWCDEQTGTELGEVRRRNISLLGDALASEYYSLDAFNLFYRWFAVDPGYATTPLDEVDFAYLTEVQPEMRGKLRERFVSWYDKHREQLVWDEKRQVFTGPGGDRLPDPFADMEIGEHIVPRQSR